MCTRYAPRARVYTRFPLTRPNNQNIVVRYAYRGGPRRTFFLYTYNNDTFAAGRALLRREHDARSGQQHAREYLNARSENGTYFQSNTTSVSSASRQIKFPGVFSIYTRTQRARRSARRRTFVFRTVVAGSVAGPFRGPPRRTNPDSEHLRRRRKDYRRYYYFMHNVVGVYTSVVVERVIDISTIRFLLDDVFGKPAYGAYCNKTYFIRVSAEHFVVRRPIIYF